MGNILSNASSTSVSVRFRVPSLRSLSMMMSEGTSSLTVSPSSSDFASHLSHGKIVVSDPLRWIKSKLQLFLEITVQKMAKKNCTTFPFLKSLLISTRSRCHPGFIPLLSCPMRIFSMMSPTSSSYTLTKYKFIMHTTAEGR